jgi:hypothetical protein
MINVKTTLAKFFRQAVQSDMHIVSDTLKQPNTMLARDKMGPMPAHFAGCNALCLPMSLAPFDNTGDTDLQNGRYRSSALSTRNPFECTFT